MAHLDSCRWLGMTGIKYALSLPYNRQDGPKLEWDEEEELEGEVMCW